MMVNSVTSNPVPAFAAPPPSVAKNKQANSSATLKTEKTAESGKSTISVQGTILTGLFAAADKFIRQEHRTPYLFDKVAAALVEQAKEKDIKLDKKDVAAQLKENNAKIAAFDNDDRRARPGKEHATRITAKENGIDHKQAQRAAKTGNHQHGHGKIHSRHSDKQPIQESTQESLENMLDRLKRQVLLDVFWNKNTDYDEARLDLTKYAELEFIKKLIELHKEGVFYLHDSSSDSSTDNPSALHGEDDDQ